MIDETFSMHYIDKKITQLQPLMQNLEQLGKEFSETTGQSKSYLAATMLVAQYAPSSLRISFSASLPTITRILSPSPESSFPFHPLGLAPFQMLSPSPRSFISPEALMRVPTVDTPRSYFYMVPR